MQQLNLAERSIVVTGAAGGLGQAVCRALIAADARVTAIVQTLDDGERLRDTLGRPANLRLVPADVTSEDAVDSALAAAEDFAGELWGLVNIVGGYSGGRSLMDSPAAELDRLFDLNVRSVFLCTRAGLRRMLAAIKDDTPHKSGRVVNIGSAMACRGVARHSAYCATKAAVMSLTESVAEDVKDRGITVNAVLPGTIDTQANRRAMPDADRSTWVSPDEVAQVVTFLLSDLASGVNASGIRVTGRG